MYAPETMRALRHLGLFLIIYGENPNDAASNEFRHLGQNFVLETFGDFGFHTTVSIEAPQWKVGLWFKRQKYKTLRDYAGVQHQSMVLQPPLMMEVNEFLMDFRPNGEKRLVGHNSMAFWSLLFGKECPKQHTFEGDRQSFERDLAVLRATSDIFRPLPIRL